MFVNCTIDDCDGTRAIYSDQHSLYYIGCTIQNCSGRGISLSNSGLGAIILDCTFSLDGIAIYLEGTTRDHFIKDCVFTDNTTDIYLSAACIGIRVQGCTLDFAKVSAPGATVTPRNFPVATFQDCGSNAKNQNATYWCMGTITRETATFIRAGGADTSIKAIPNSGADDDPNTPFVFYETWIYNPGALATYTVYVLADGTWAALPSSAQLWLEANYFDQAGDAGRANIKSDEAIAVEETWTALNVACTPAAAGLVNLRLCLNKYEASKEIWADPLIVVA
jgi:hypothetical protein